MKHKVCELEGALLDAAVALCEPWRVIKKPVKDWYAWRAQPAGDPEHLVVPVLDWCPSASWHQGGPIIEREGIELFCIDRNGRRIGEWQARLKPPRIVHGPTALVAAMRAFVMARLGEEVELPE